MARKPPEVASPIVAAGTSLAPSVKRGTRSISALKKYSGQGWQSEAWDFYDLVGEYRYAVDLTGNMLSKAKLGVERLNDDGLSYEPVTSGPAYDAIMQFFGGPVNQGEYLRLAGIHMSVSGECYVISWVDGGIRNWRVADVSEISSNTSKVTLSGNVIPDPNAFVMRQWQPHPRKHDVANSPSQALVPTLAEIYRLSQHIQAQVISRLASAGLFLITDEVNVSPPEGLVDEDKLASMNSGDSFVAQLTAAMDTAIKDRSSASAVVPIVLTVPPDVIEKFRHITFWSELDEKSQQMRDDAINRLALGVDLPPEALTGTGDMSHWQAWLSDETSIKAHTQPTLARITASLTQGYLHPALKGVVEDWGRYRVVADDSAMRIRPNRSKEAIELFDRGELSAEAMRRENGFSENDAMSEDDLKRWLTKKVASGSTTPEMVQAAIERLGVLLNPPKTIEQVPVQEARPDRSLKDHPTRDFPQENAGLVAACDMLTLRALERAGNKIKNRLATRPEGVPAAEYYLYQAGEFSGSDMNFLLKDAWSHVPEVAEEYDVPADRLTEALDAYSRSLLSGKTRRDKVLLCKHLSLLDRRDV